MTAHNCNRLDDDDRPLKPLQNGCNNCGRSWCERCDPSPAALCHYCHGRGYSTAPLNTHYIVKDAAACMPASCWGRYRRVAVLEIDDAYDNVAMISERARGVVRIVETWERLHHGTTDRCAYAHAVDEANALAAELNNTTH